MRALLKSAGAPETAAAGIERAFVHSSAAREGMGTSNERLEFYGDAILGFLAARWLVAKYPQADEGELTFRRQALISGDACAVTARRLGFGELMLLGHGMEQTGGGDNTTILADAFEAFIAALYEATDLEVTGRYLEREHFAAADKARDGAADAKTALQEFAQAALRMTPMYFERAEGPPHDRRFTSQVRIGDEILGEGIGASKKAAQQSAAAMALATLQSRHIEPPPAPAAATINSSDVISLAGRRARTPRKPRPGAKT